MRARAGFACFMCIIGTFTVVYVFPAVVAGGGVGGRKSLSEVLGSSFPDRPRIFLEKFWVLSWGKKGDPNFWNFGRKIGD